MPTSMTPHATFPHIPAKSKTRAETGCNSCPVAALHPSCASFGPDVAATTDEVLNAFTLLRDQWRVHRMQLDAEGIKGAEGDDWYEYNADNTINYVYFSSWNVVSVSGDEMTLETQDASDPREVVFNTYTLPSPDDGTGIIQVTGYQTKGCLQAGYAVGRFSDNSVLRSSCWPVIIQILSVDTVAHTVTVKCDKSVDNALTYVDDEDTTDITIKVYQYASPENWQHIIKPDYFYGQRQLRIIEVVDVPMDGVVTLESDAPVMHPGGFDALSATWVLEGYHTVNEEWETVPQEDERLFIIPNKAYVALKTTKPAEGISSLTLSDDLTATYSRFRVTYFKYSSSGAQGCSVTGYSRCKFALPDYSQSVGNYQSLTAGTAVEGVGVDSTSGHWYCGKRLMDNHTLSDEAPEGALDGIRETATHFQTSASGVGRFPATGRCLQYGCCDSWVPAENDTGRDSPFRYDYHAGYVLRELWGAAPHRVIKPAPTVDFWQAQRIMHPSLSWLVGYAFPATQQSGFHEITTSFGAWGAWGYPLTVTDGVTGDQTIVPQYGPFENYNLDEPDAQGDGFFPEYVTGFKTTRDQIDAGATVTLPDLERIGVAIERDTGQLEGRGISQASIATAAQNLIVAPNVDITLLDTEQSSAVGSFQRFSDASDAELRLIPLRQETKSATNIGTRTVASVTDLGSGRVQIAFKNVSHSYGYVDAVLNPGVDTVDTWLGGGGYPICPDTKDEIHNFYETDKTTGSKLRGAWRGDSIAVTIGGDVRHFILESVTAHGGSAEGSWGGDTPSDSYSLGGDYLSVGQLQDICVAYDENGVLAALVEDDTVDFWWSAAVAIGGTAQWTAYGTDTWADVTGAVAWPASGVWYIPDSWFSDKPDNICFRLSQVEWMDHRGTVPGSVIEKTQDSIDAIQWVNCGFDGTGSNYSFSKSIFRNFSFELNEDETCQTGDTLESAPSVTTGSGGTNGFSVGRGDPIATGSTLGSTSNAAITVNSSPVGMPLPMRFFPDGTTLLDVKLQVNSSGLTRTKTRERVEMYNCDASVATTAINESSTTVEGITFAIIGFTSENDFSVIGYVSASDQESQVISGTEITAVFQAMLDARSAGTYPYGYGALFMPQEYAAAGDVETLAPGVPEFTELSGDCYGECGSQYVWNEWDQISLTWSSLSFGSLALKVQYPQTDKDRLLIQPRWPSMKNTV